MGRRLGRSEIGFFFYLSNWSWTCICKGFYQQILTKLTPISFFKSWLRDIFLCGFGRPVGSEAIANRLNLLPYLGSSMIISRFWNDGAQKSRSIDMRNSKSLFLDGSSAFWKPGRSQSRQNSVESIKID